MANPEPLAHVTSAENNQVQIHFFNLPLPLWNSPSHCACCGCCFCRFSLSPCESVHLSFSCFISLSCLLFIPLRVHVCLCACVARQQRHRWIESEESEAERCRCTACKTTPHKSTRDDWRTQVKWLTRVIFASSSKCFHWVTLFCHCFHLFSTGYTITGNWLVVWVLNLLLG